MTLRNCLRLQNLLVKGGGPCDCKSGEGCGAGLETEGLHRLQGLSSVARRPRPSEQLKGSQLGGRHLTVPDGPKCTTTSFVLVKPSNSSLSRSRLQGTERSRNLPGAPVGSCWVPVGICQTPHVLAPVPSTSPHITGRPSLPFGEETLWSVPRLTDAPQ